MFLRNLYFLLWEGYIFLLGGFAGLGVRSIRQIGLIFLRKLLLLCWLFVLGILVLFWLGMGDLFFLKMFCWLKWYFLFFHRWGGSFYLIVLYRGVYRFHRYLGRFLGEWEGVFVLFYCFFGLRSILLLGYFRHRLCILGKLFLFVEKVLIFFLRIFRGMLGIGIFGFWLGRICLLLG